MALPTRAETEERIANALDAQHLSGNWENVSIVREVLGRLSLEDHLLMAEQMLATLRVKDPRWNPAHQALTNALDHVEIVILESI